MLQRIKSSLFRQEKAFKLLLFMLREEFNLMQGKDPRLISKLEFSIQELLQQLVREREDLRAMVQELGGPESRLMHLVQEFPEESRKECTLHLKNIDELEQDCAKQADVNSEIALALVDQSRSLLEYLQKELLPKKQSTYTARGKMYKSQINPSRLQGRY